MCNVKTNPQHTHPPVFRWQVKIIEKKAKLKDNEHKERFYSMEICSYSHVSDKCNGTVHV